MLGMFQSVGENYYFKVSFLAQTIVAQLLLAVVVIFVLHFVIAIIVLCSALHNHVILL